MKTVYTIGRDPGCDIYLYDDKKLISRNHAILKIGKGGKLFISDQSMNGTYINGVKIASGAQVPVTRKDVVSFAHVAELDWGMVPNPAARNLKITLICILTALLLGGATWGVLRYIESRTAPVIPPPTPAPTEETMSEEEKKKREEDTKKWQEELEAKAAKKEGKKTEKEADRTKEEETKKGETPKKTESETAKKAEEENETIDAIY